MPSPPVAVVTIVARRDRVHAGRRRAGRATIAKVVLGRAWSPSFASPGSTSPSTTPSTCWSAIALGVGDPAQRVPLLHAERGRSRSRTAGARRPTSMSAGARGEAIRQAVQRPARADRGRPQARRPGRLRRLDAAAAAGGRRPRPVPLREALRDEPCPGRPLVQDRAAPSSTGASRTRRRSSRCGAWSSTRTTPLRLVRDVGHPDRGAVRHRRDDAGAGVPARHRVLRRRRRRSATPRSTTASSTRACCSCASSGTPAWPTATSSRPTCWSWTASCCSSTSRSRRCARRRGARPSTWPT